MELKVIKLTKKVFDQIQPTTYSALPESVRTPDGNVVDSAVIGWVNLPSSYNYWLVLQVGEGQYVKLEAGYRLTRKYKQIFIA